MKKLNSKTYFNNILVVRSIECEELLCFSHIDK